MTAFPATEEGWRKEALVMRKAIDAAPHLFALDSLMDTLKPKLEALKAFSEPAHDFLVTRAEKRRQAMIGVV